MTEAGPSPDEPVLERYLTLLRRRWPALVATTLAVTAVALVVRLGQEEVYRASADVYLSRLDVAGQLGGVSDFRFNQPSERVVQTQAELARVPAVAQGAVDEAGLPDITSGDLLGASTVTPKLNADLLQFAVRHEQPSVAIELANAYATAYARYRADLDAANIQRVIDRIDRELEGLDVDDPTQRRLITTLNGDRQQLRTVLALQSSNATVVRTAGTASTVEDSVLSAGAAGAAIGLAVGVALALLLEALDRRVRSAAEIARRLGAPLLGRLPSPRRRRGRFAGLVMLEQNTSEEAEAYRMARANVERALEGRTPSLMVSSAAREVDVSPIVTANLALALARGSRQTILVDLDLRQAPLDALFGTGERPGLTDVVAGETDISGALVTVWRGDANVGPVSDGLAGDADAGTGVVDLLPAGRQVASVGELLASSKLHEVVQRLRYHADLIVIHGPPLLGTADAMAVLGAVGGVVVVAGVGVTGRDELDDVRDELEGVGDVLGVLVTGIGRSTSGGRHRSRGHGRRGRVSGRRSRLNGYRAAAPARTASRH
jgi:polysaccharide biosynthesis transport protein